MNYIEDARYFQFMIESAIENEKINGFVKSVIGVSEGASIEKLWAIHEDVGDKIRNLWDKFIAFLNRVWAKFIENTNKLINSDKGYLEKYKDIILNNKPEDVEIEMREYAVGIHNMTSHAIPPFTQVKDKVPIDSEDISFKTELIGDYKDATKDFAGFCVAYFEGGETKIKTNLTSLNMTDLYNYCHDFDKIKSVIEKDQSTVAKTYTDSQAAIQKAKANVQQGKPAVEPATTADNTQNNQQQTADNTQGDTGTAAPKVITQPLNNNKPQKFSIQNKLQGQHASYSLDDYMGSYFTEADDKGNSGVVIGPSKAAPNSGQNTAVTTGGAKASQNMATTQTSKEPTVSEGEDLDTLLKKINNYDTATSAILTAKMTAATAIFKDYLKIIKIHVGHHVGKDGETQIAQTGSDYRQALQIDNPQQVLQTIATIRDPKTDPNTKSKLTSDLNKQVIEKNPNFPGGLDAIEAAAKAAPKK